MSSVASAHRTGDLRFDAIGTRWRIRAAEPLATDAVQAVLDRCDEFDRTWSRFRVDSLVQRLATAAGRVVLPPESVGLQELYRRLYEATDGAMNPLVGRALEQHGYDGAYSLRPAASVAPVPRWEEAISWEERILEAVRPVVLDVGAAGKGLLVDLVAATLEQRGIPDATIDASGDIRHRGGRPLRIALEHPRDPSRAIGVATLESGALCASASNRRSWADTHHVLDALTGCATNDVIATWVTADDAMTADGLATALFFVDAERLREHGFGFEWVRMGGSGRVESSPGFPAELFR